MIADSYYLDSTGLKDLNDRHIPFICAVSSRRFSELFTLGKKALPTTHTARKWVAMANDSRGLKAVYRLADQKRTPKVVMANCFTMSGSRGPSSVPVWDEYGHGASACDEFNRQLAGKYWPFRRMSWEHSIDDMAFTATLIDIFNLYRVANNITSTNTDEPMRALAFDLYRHSISL